MTKFASAIKEFVEHQDGRVIRISRIHNGSEPETVEFIPVHYCQNIYSVAKMYTMTGIGLLYDRGLVKPEDKVCDILKDELPEKGMDERWYSSTVDMALRHSLGLPGGFLDIDVVHASAFGENFLTYMLTYPLQYTPGTKFVYSDGAFYLLARIAEKVSGENLDNFMWRELLYPLSYREMAWSHCPMGHVIGATGLYVTSEDMTKLGQVYLEGGTYKGKRLMSKEWIDMAFARSYGLDMAGEDCYAKGGMYGQTLMVDRKHNSVLAIQSFDADIGPIMEFARNWGDND